MPADQTAGVVVIGSGAFGASTAYHLARRGADVVLLDQHALGLADLAARGGAHEQGRQDAGDGAASRRGRARRSRTSSRRWAARWASTARAASRRPIPRPARRASTRASTPRGSSTSRPSWSRPPSAEQLAPHFKPGRARAIGYVPSDGWLDPAKVASGFIARATELGARMHAVHAGARAPAGGRARRGRGDAEGRDQRARRRGRRGRVDGARGGGRGHRAAPRPGTPPALHHRADPGRRATPAHRAAPRGERLRAPRAGRPPVRRLRGPAPRDRRRSAWPRASTSPQLDLDLGRAPRARRRGDRALPGAAHRARGGAPRRRADDDARWPPDPRGACPASTASTSPRAAAWAGSASRPRRAARSPT